jgi:tetratricopeptide (TPR) repeat protein
MRYRRGEYETATRNLTRGLELYIVLGVRMGQANALTGLGIVQHQRGEYDMATHHLTRGLQLYTALSCRNGVAETLTNLGDLALDYPHAGDSRGYFSQALTIARETGAVVLEAHALSGQARCLLRTANIDEAIVLLRQAHALYQSLRVPEAAEIRSMLSTLETSISHPHATHRD